MLFYWTADGRFELYYTQLIVIYGWNLHSTRRADDDFFRFRNNNENAPQSRIRANTHSGYWMPSIFSLRENATRTYKMQKQRFL